MLGVLVCSGAFWCRANVFWCVFAVGLGRPDEWPINTLIDYPLNQLDMSKHCIDSKYAIRSGEKPIYDLYAVSNHFGRMGFGHYTAHCRDVQESQWYTLDDSSCRPCSENDVKSKAGYVLFYQLRKK